MAELDIRTLSEGELMRVFGLLKENYVGDQKIFVHADYEETPNGLVISLLRQLDSDPYQRRRLILFPPAITDYKKIKWTMENYHYSVGDANEFISITTVLLAKLLGQ